MSTDHPRTGPAAPHHRAVAHSAPLQRVSAATAPAGPGCAGPDSRPVSHASPAALLLASRSTLVFRGLPRTRAPRILPRTPAAAPGTAAARAAHPTVEPEALDPAATVELDADSAATGRLEAADPAATAELEAVDPAATVALDASDLEPTDLESTAPAFIDPGTTVQISTAAIAALLARAGLPDAPARTLPDAPIVPATGNTLAAAAARRRRSLLATALLRGVLATCILLGAFFVLTMLVRSGSLSL